MVSLVVVVCCTILYVLPCFAQNSSQPYQRHVTMADEQVTGKRILVVGDVHGCFDEMIDLLKEANVLKGDGVTLFDDAMVIFTGDTVNKGPKSAKVLRFVRTTDRVYSVRGNHEDNCLAPGAKEKYPWINACPQEDFALIETLPYTISIPKFQAHIVHAGLMPNINNLKDQSVFVMTRMRNIDEQDDGSMIPYEETLVGRNWGKVWSDYQTTSHVYYGHDARRGKLGPQRHDYATGLDTRCSKGGELTGVFMPIGDENFSSVACPDYRAFSTDVPDDHDDY